VTTLAPGTFDAYAHVAEVLDAALRAYRHPDVYGPGKTTSRNGVVLVCPCERKVRASTTVATQGPVICGLCQNPFLPENDGSSGD
jgi:hypothetical protein